MWGKLPVRYFYDWMAAWPLVASWRDALAVLSVILPVLILLTSAASETRLLLSFPAPGAFA